MARTYSSGRKRFKRQDCKHGHCWLCGWDPRVKGKKKTQLKKEFKFDILPYIEQYIL